MDRDELARLIGSGEHSGVEFKRDDLRRSGWGEWLREHNGTDPDLVEEEDRFTVRLWKQRPGAVR